MRQGLRSIRQNIFIILLMLFASLPAPAQAGNSVFHPPLTEAEKALDAIFEKDRHNDANMYAYILGRPDYNSAKDTGYAHLMTAAFLHAVRQQEKDQVRTNCQGQYREGEICGIDVHLPLCGSDTSDIGFLYHTMRQSETVAYISYIWAEDKENAALTPSSQIRMRKEDGVWKLDGVSCDNTMNFNM